MTLHGMPQSVKFKLTHYPCAAVARALIVDLTQTDPYTYLGER